MICWSPTEGENCTSNYTTLSDFHTKNPEFEKKGQMLENDIHSVFRSPELGNYELLYPFNQKTLIIAPPDEVKGLIK